MTQQDSSNNIFHITVGATPEGNGEVSLNSELRLLKAALLYGDRVKFCSLSSSLLIALLQFSQLSAEGMLQIIAPALRNAELDRGLEIFAELKGKKQRNYKEVMLLRKIQRYLAKAESDARQYFEKLLLDAGLNHLESAFNTGLVEIQIFEGTDTDGFTKQYLDTISEAVLSGETYPLFDDLTGNLVNWAIREGKIAPSEVSINRAKQISLSADLLSRLPLFDNVPVDQIIDIRKELNKPLVRFRSAIIGFSRDVQNASWDNEFPKEAEQVFREHVEPAILEIEEECKSNKLLFRLIPDFVDKPIVPAAASALAVLLADATQLPTVVANGLGLAAGAAATTLRSVQEWQEKNREIESNQLYFYYRAGKLISK